MNENKTYFAKAVSDTKKFNFKDVFSNVFNKHSKKDLDYVFSSGLDLDRQSGSLIDNWQKPWVFSRVLLYGIIAWVILNLLISFGCDDSITEGASFIIPCLVVPFSVVVFFWEMNIPRNIPIYDVIKFIIFGGIFCSIGCSVVNAVIGTGLIDKDSPLNTFTAALSEEVTKLIIIAFLLRKSERCWGLNGLLIGAAVGAGFAVFETNGYALSAFSDYFNPEIYNKLLKEYAKESTNPGFNVYFDAFNWAKDILTRRGACAICGHVAYAAPYGCALALAKGRQKLNSKHFADKDFLICFLASVFLHFCWNYQDDFLTAMRKKSAYISNLLSSGFINSSTIHYITTVIFVIIQGAIILYLMRKCVRQVVEYNGSHSNNGNVYERQVKASDFSDSSNGISGSGRASAKKLYIKCESGVLSGQTYSVESGRTVMIGRNQNLAVCFPENEKGISRVHCSVSFKGHNAVLVDKNSSHGTFTSDGKKIQPELDVVLNNGDTFWLASSKNTFKVVIH